MLSILIHYAISCLFLVPEPFLMFFLQCKCAFIEADRTNCFEHLSHREWGSIGDWFNITLVKGSVWHIKIRELLRGTCKLKGERVL